MASPTIPKLRNRLVALTILISALFLVACQSTNSNDPCFDYPKQIDSLHVQDLYDTARLYLFTWLCDRKVDNHYRAQYDLKYKGFFLRNDSMELFFTHTLPKELQDSISGDNRHLPSMAFNLKTRQKLWGCDINGFSDALEPGNLRFKSPASNEVVNFIRNHTQILNPCFRELLKRNHLLAN